MRSVLVLLINLINVSGFSQTYAWNKFFNGYQEERAFGTFNGGSKTSIHILLWTLSPQDRDIKNSIIYGVDSIPSDSSMEETWIIKLDTSGKLIWGHPVFLEGSLSINNWASDEQDNIYLTGEILSDDDSAMIYDSNVKLKRDKKGIDKFFLIKYNKKGHFQWCRSLSHAISLNRMVEYYNGNLYFGLYNRQNLEPVVFNSDTIKNINFIAKFDTAGSFINYYELGEGQYDVLNKIAHEGDSLVVFVVPYLSKYKYKNYLLDASSTSHLLKVVVSEKDKNKYRITKLTSDNSMLFAAMNLSVTKLQNETYFFSGTLLNNDTFQLNGFHPLCAQNLPFTFCISKDMVISAKIFNGEDNFRGSFYISNSEDGYAFLRGAFLGNIRIYDSISHGMEGNTMICKMDSFCNVLWYVRTGDSSLFYSMMDIVFDNHKGLYYVSNFHDYTYLDDKIYRTTRGNKGYDVSFSKILDFSITRGPVRSGPYCAGDSILIPFTKDGNFNSDNVFIAELSDENGQFEGRHRELGRIKTNNDSTVIGLLPLFDVISSKNYRIRILSTSPRVQSYYRYDTLRLLIYSKDTANAGGDTTICYGGVTRLSTTGGSKWRWSPGHLVEDSTARITYTKPITDSTLFRIIISDSSGCGKTDTAYKMLRTYKPLQIVNSDTTLCNKGSVLTAKVQGGQPLLYPYVYRWYNDQGKLISKHHSLNTDTMHLNQLQLVVGDNCSGLNDSQWIQINDYPQPQLQLPQDTVVCHAQLYRLRIKAEGGRYPLVCWLANNRDTILLGHELDSTFLPSNGQAIKLIAHDDCSELSDTTEMKIAVLMPLNAKVALTPDCYKDTVKLSANCSGGKLTSYQTQWYNESMQIIGSDSFLNYSSKGNQQHIIFQLSDACSPVFKDTITLTPMLNAKLQVNKDEQCLAGNLFEFKVEVDTLNNNFMSQKVQIPFNDIVHSRLNYSASFKDTGHYKVQLKVQSKSNQCLDSTELMVYVRPQPLIHVNWIRSTDSYDSSRWRFSATADVPMRSYLWFIDQFPAQADDTVWQNFHYEGRVKIHVTGTDVYGCIEDSTFWFDMVHRMRFYIPNAVTDNGDGINDDFYIPGSEYMQEYRLKIFNRWGEKVFDSDDPQEHFKPEFDASSVYIYTLTIFDIYNERHLLKGVFEVLR